MIVISCSHGKHLGKKIAQKAGAQYSELFLDKFPDNELRVRIQKDVKSKEVIFVQSFYGQINDLIVECILAAETTKELGAKKVKLVAPYFPYLRQDKRFNPGEAISQAIIGKLFGKYFDEIFVMDPHLHRTKSLNDVFSVKSQKLTANALIADYIKKKIKNPVIIGPDEESYKWAKHVADMIKVESRILKKKRYSSFHVEVRLNKKIDLGKRSVVIVDDIISTGHTIIETAKILRKLGARKITCICVHGIFVNDCLEKLQREKIEVVACNTIPNKVSKIDVSGMFSIIPGKQCP